MIVSHRHQFIFLKTRKTAGTSVELALRKIIGPDDVATPLSRDEERFASDNGITGPQNYISLMRDIDIKRLPDLIKSVEKGLRTGKSIPRAPVFNPYRQHLNAFKARYKIGKKKWGDYFKFAIERNPWERTVAYYHWICRNETNPPSFTEFVQQGRSYPFETNYAIYSIKGIPVADHWVRYENLTRDLDEVSSLLKLSIALGAEVEKIWTKSQSRERPHYTNYYDALTRRVIELQFANEIKLMGYTFDN